MKPADFEYRRAGSVEDALTALEDDPSGETKIIAGGQSLVTLMNLRLARPSVLVDVLGLGELGRVFDDTDQLVLGALVRHRTMETDPLVARRVPMAAAAARHIGHVGIRNRGTLGGALAHADPAAELPAVMVALGATLHAESTARGRRQIAAEEFFVSVFTTALEPDEMVTWVSVPSLRPRQGWGFTEYAPRHGDYAVAGAACLLTVDDDGAVAGARAVLLNAADRPLLVSGEADLLGERATPQLWAKIGRHWARQAEPSGEDPEYVRALCGEALAEALSDSYRRALEARGAEEAA